MQQNCPTRTSENVYVYSFMCIWVPQPFYNLQNLSDSLIFLTLSISTDVSYACVNNFILNTTTIVKI